MKFLKQVLYVAMMFSGITMLAWNTPAFAGGEVKEVCETVKDKKGNVVKNKDGSEKQACKKIKTHKKVEGEKVPEKK